MLRLLDRSLVVVATVLHSGWQRRGVVTTTVVVGVAAALQLASQTSYTYQGTAQVLIGPPPGAATSTGATVGVRPAEVADAAVVMASPALRRDTATLLSLRPAAVPPATASVLPGTDVVQVRVVTGSAKGAAADAVAYADAYVAAQQLSGVDDLEQTASSLTARITALGVQVAGVDASIVAAGGQVPTTTTPTTAQAQYTPIPGYQRPAAATAPLTIAPDRLPSGNAAVDALTAKRTALVDQQAVLQQQATTLQTDAEAFSGGGQVVSGGVPDTHPVSPDLAASGVAGGLIALLLAVAAVTVLEWRRHGPIVPRFATAAEGAPPVAAAAAVQARQPATEPTASTERTLVLRARAGGGEGGSGRGTVRFVARQRAAVPVPAQSPAPPVRLRRRSSVARRRADMLRRRARPLSRR